MRYDRGVRPFVIQRHPCDPPFSEAELDELRRVLPDPETTLEDGLVVPLVEWRDPIGVAPPAELLGDARGVPPPEREAFVRHHRFVRRHREDLGWFWHCAPPLARPPR